MFHVKVYHIVLAFRIKNQLFLFSTFFHQDPRCCSPLDTFDFYWELPDIGHQISHPYVSWVLTNVKCKVRLTWVFVISKHVLLRRPSILFAFYIWGSHFRLLDTRRPRYFSALHDDNSFPYIRYGDSIGFRFLVTFNTLHFPVLNFILDFVLHFSSMVKFSCNDWQLSTDLISLYNFASSAYNAEFVLVDTLLGNHLQILRKAMVPAKCYTWTERKVDFPVLLILL
jgi:hypothetical protein